VEHTVSTDLAQHLADLKQGDHVCLIYESDAERLAAVAADLKRKMKSY